MPVQSGKIRFLWSVVTFLLCNFYSPFLTGLRDVSASEISCRSGQITIDSTTVLDDTNDLLGPYEITSRVMSPDGIAGVFLYHRADDESTFTIQAMPLLSEGVYSVGMEGPGRGGGFFLLFSFTRWTRHFP